MFTGNLIKIESVPPYTTSVPGYSLSTNSFANIDVLSFAVLKKAEHLSFVLILTTLIAN